MGEVERIKERSLQENASYHFGTCIVIIDSGKDCYWLLNHSEKSCTKELSKILTN